jgi:hypothetical protein
VLARLAALALAGVLLVRLLGAERATVPALLVGALPLTLLPAYPLLALAAALRQRWLAPAARPWWWRTSRWSRRP